MFGRTDKTHTIHGQLTDNNDIDEAIENKIKACQRENGRCMTSTSNRLREKYGYDNVNRVLSRLNKRRTRGNKYQKQESDQMENILELILRKVNESKSSL